MKVELASRGRVAINGSTKTVPHGEKDDILVVNSSMVAILEKNQTFTRLTRKLGFLTRVGVLAASEKGNYVAGATENGQIFRFDNLNHAQWVDSPGLEKSKVEQICVDGNGNILVSSGTLCVYKFSVRSLSWEAFSCPFTLPESVAVRLVGCSVSNSSDTYATFAWLLNDNRLIVCNIGYQFLDRNQWRLRETSPSFFPCSSLTPSPDLSCFLLLSPSTIHLVHNSSSLAHFQREFTEESVVNATWCRNSELILVLSPGGKLAILAKFMNSLFGFEQTGNEHGVPSNWMHVVNVEVGEPLELRPHLSLYSDALIVTGSEVLSISVEPMGHTLYLGKLLSAQPLSIAILSELCLHLASVKTLHKDHVLLLAVVKKNLSRGLALCDDSQLGEICRVFCALLDWAVQLESVSVVKLMVFALRRFMKVDKNKKYRDEMLSRYTAALKIFDANNKTTPHVRLEPGSHQRRRTSSITECYYNGDTVGAMNCLAQHAEITSQSKELMKRLLDTKQEIRAFEALIIVLSSQGPQLFEVLQKAPKVRHLFRSFASKIKQPSVAFELLFLAGYWRDALELSSRLGKHGLETLVAISLHELRRAAEALRDFIIGSLNELDGDLHNSSITIMVTNFLRLNPVTSDDLFVETLDLLLSEFLQECSRTSFDSPGAMLITVEVESDLTSQPSRLQLVCRSIQLLLICSETYPHLLDSLTSVFQGEDNVENVPSANHREISLLTCFVNMLFCFQLRRLLFQESENVESIQLAQQLYLNSFIPSHWLSNLAQMVYTPSRSEEEAQRKALCDFYDTFCQDLCNARTKLRQPTRKAEVNVSPLSFLEKAFLSTKKATRLSHVRHADLVLVNQDCLKGKLDSVNVNQARLKSGAKVDLCVLSDLLLSAGLVSSRAFLCGVLLHLDLESAKRVRFNPIVDVAIAEDDDDEFEESRETDEQPQQDEQRTPSSPRCKLQKSFSTSDAAVQADQQSAGRKLVRRLDTALRSLERISKLQKQMITRNEDKVKDEEEDFFDLEEEMEQIALKDIRTNSKSRPFSTTQIPGEGKFEESMRRIRELTSRSIQKYQTSTKGLRSSLRASSRQGSTRAGLRLKVRPTESGVHTTMIIDGRSSTE